jgi:hypothetical protein
MGCWVGFLDLKKDNVRGVEKHCNVLYCSQDIKWVIESRRMRWVGHVAGVGKRRGAYRDLVGRLEGRDHLGDLSIDGTIILKLIFSKWDGLA